MMAGDLTREDRHRSINYRLCTALDLTKLGIVLDGMVAEGVLPEAEARTFQVQASALLASLCNANNRAFGKASEAPFL